MSNSLLSKLKAKKNGEVNKPAETTPAKKPVGVIKKPVGRPAKEEVVAAEEEELLEEVTTPEEEEVVEQSELVPDDEAGGDDDTGETADQDDEEEVVQTKPTTKVVPPKKVVPKVTKASADKDTDEDGEAVTKEKTPKPLFGTRKPAAEKVAREYGEGELLPRDVWVGRLHEMVSADFDITQSQLDKFLRAIEAGMEKIIPTNVVQFIGMRFKHVPVEARIYAPNPALERVATPYHTLVNEHLCIKAVMQVGRSRTRGTVDDAGNFIEGMFDEDGNFVEGTWASDDEFTPAQKKVVAAGKKKK